MDGVTVGVFGSEPASKSAFLAALAKKSEAEGIAVYHRAEGGRKVSFLDDTQFPERVQGYGRIASICDYACYIFPTGGRLAPPDGELAVLLDSFQIPGRIEVIDGVSSPDAARAALKGTRPGGYEVEERGSGSSAIDLSSLSPREDLSGGGTLVYVDRAFSVKGVGTVALGFVLSGKVSVHDTLRPLPLPRDARAEVRGIQINDEDYDSAGRGMRVGLSLRGVEAEDLQRTTWLDDGSRRVSDFLEVDFRPSPFYKQELAGRDMHLQLPGVLTTAKLAQGSSPTGLTARLQWAVPVWEGMRVAVVDLNARGLRVAGGGSCKV